MSAKVNIKCVRVAANGGGNQDITLTGFGTPKAALFIVTNATADDNATDSCTMSIGATDGTREWCYYMRDLDGAATTTTIRGASNARLIKLRTTVPGNLGEAHFVSWITDGVRINWDVTAGSAYLITVVLFGGTDLSAYANQNNLEDTVINTVGFEANVVLCASNGETATGESTTSAAQMNFGVATNQASTVVNKGLFWQARDNVATTEISAYAASAKCTGRLGATAVSTQVNLETFTASGFTVNSDGGASTDSFGYLALKTGAKVNAQLIATPTATGAWNVTGVGFKPQCVILPFSKCTDVDTRYSGLGSENFCMGVMDGIREYANDISSEDNVADTNSWSKLDNKAMDTYLANGTSQLFDFQFSSFGTDGFTVTVLAQDGTAHLLMPISFGDSSRPADFWPFMAS